LSTFLLIFCKNNPIIIKVLDRILQNIILFYIFLKLFPRTAIIPLFLSINILMTEKLNVQTLNEVHKLHFWKKISTKQFTVKRSRVVIWKTGIRIATGHSLRMNNVVNKSRTFESMALKCKLYLFKILIRIILNACKRIALYNIIYQQPRNYLLISVFDVHTLYTSRYIDYTRACVASAFLLIVRIYCCSRVVNVIEYYT